MSDLGSNEIHGNRPGLPARSGPLAGIVVVDLSRALAGPYATLMLGDAGAQVVKVERPGSGDDSRSWGPPFARPQTDSPSADSQSTYFLSVNRNKLSVELDFWSTDGRGQLDELLRRADVVVDNFRPEVRERLGLTESELALLNPRLVALSITGFGEDGPDGGRPGYDQILQGEGGLMSMTGQPDGPPTKVGVPIADILAGMFGAFGVVAALRERDQTGKGQVVRTSLLAATIAVHAYQGTRWLIAGEVPGREGDRHRSITPYGSYECADASINVAVASEKLWQSFAPLVGLEPSDPRFTNNELRRTNRVELDALIERSLRSHSAETWLSRFAQAGIPAGLIKSLDQVYTTPQVEHLGLIDTLEHPSLGVIRLPGSPLSYSSDPPGASLSPPLLGEHNEMVRRWIASSGPEAGASDAP